MSRRDTILIAILINMGLLLILFITAMSSVHEEMLAEEQVNDELVQALPTPQKPIQRNKVETILREAEAPEKKIAVVEDKKEAVAIDDKYVQVKVKRGDILGEIAAANGTTVDELMTLNGLENSRLEIGQQLRVPKATPVAEVDEEEFEKLENEAQYYVMKSGDNPWLIAMKHRLKLDDLLKLNDLDESRARRLKPGDRIRIR